MDEIMENADRFDQNLKRFGDSFDKNFYGNTPTKTKVAPKDEPTNDSIPNDNDSDDYEDYNDDYDEDE